MERLVRYSDDGKGTHMSLPIHGEDEQSETNTAGGEAEAQETGALNPGEQHLQSGAAVWK